jgi:hypothetical protein
MVTVARWTADVDEGGCTALAMDGEGNLYAGMSTIPAVIDQIDLARQTISGKWIGDSGVDECSALLYSAGQFAFQENCIFAGFSGTPSKVALIDIRMDGYGDFYDVYLHPDGLAEEDAIEIDSSRLMENSIILLDLSALTQTTTIRVYIKIDGVNYELVNSIEYPTDLPVGATGLPIQLYPLSVEWKITIQSSFAEGAARDIPYRYVRRTLSVGHP